MKSNMECKPSGINFDGSTLERMWGKIEDFASMLSLLFCRKIKSAGKKNGFCTIKNKGLYCKTVFWYKQENIMESRKGNNVFS